MLRRAFLTVARKEVLALGARLLFQRHFMEQESLKEVALLRVKKERILTPSGIQSSTDSQLLTDIL